MPVLPVTVAHETPQFDAGRLAAALDALPEGAPVVAMIHGFRYAPGAGRHCPHGHILSLTPTRQDRAAVSWPRHLGLGAPRGGLALAIGWNARVTIWQAYAAAEPAGTALARLIAEVRRLDPHRPVDVIAHSLGARVALSALPHLDAGAVGRMVLMSAAEFRDRTEARLDTPAGRACAVVNVTSRENDLFDLCMEWAVAGGFRAALGHGLSHPREGWLDLQIDAPATEAALARLGFRLAPRRTRVCHWSPYLRPGLFRLYRALFDRRISPALLRAHLPRPEAGRGTRLRPPLPRLPLRGNPA